MEADLIEGAAGDLKAAGSDYSAGTVQVGRSWSPVGIAYVTGVGREGLLNAMMPPQLHGKAMKVLTELCATELSQLATELTTY